MDHNPDIVEKSTSYIFNLFKERLKQSYVYHNYAHTIETTEVAREMAEKSGLSAADLEVLVLGALFHDTGYVETYIGHEEKSVEIAEEFLLKEGYDRQKLQEVVRLISSTKKCVEPKDILEEILHDADVINIGKKDFFFRAELLRVEWELFLDRYYTDFEWEKLQLEFLLTTTFYTEYAVREYGEKRGKNIEEQRQNVRKAKKKRSKDIQKRKQTERPRRGIETMYRSTYRNHINLSSIADSKANMMISINTIIMSVIITVVGSGFSITGSNFYEHLRFTLPIAILLLGALISVIFAIMSARPNVTKKKVSKEKIKAKKSSVLFFGNFTNMELPDFIENMNELMGSKELLYDNMTIDLYYLGKVLTRKYKLLRISYSVFMASLILCVLAFLTVFAFSYEPA